MALFSIGLLFGVYSLYEKISYGILSHEYYPLISVVFILTAMQLMSFSLIMDYIINKLNIIDEKLSRQNSVERFR
jgi:hypothetical protein